MYVGLPVLLTPSIGMASWQWSFHWLVPWVRCFFNGMIHRTMLSGLTNNKKTFLWERPGTSIELKVSENAANTRRETVKDFQKAWRVIAQRTSGSLEAKYEELWSGSEVLYSCCMLKPWMALKLLPHLSLYSKEKWGRRWVSGFKILSYAQYWDTQHTADF